jgi:DNA repair protein RadC
MDGLSNEELLSLLFNEKTARIILHRFNDNLSELFIFPIESLYPKIHREELSKIKAILELWKRALSRIDQHVISSTEDVLSLFAPHMVYQKQEEFKVVLLNSKSRVLHHQTVSLGSLNAAVVHPRDVFRPAISFSAASIILIHNHPSGDPTPSDEDIALTRQLCLCGNVMDIPVIDHIIIGIQGYTSLKKKGFV